MLSKFFIYRPIFASVISIVISLIGVISIPLLPIESMPNITPPSVKVSTTYPGASASVVAESVTAPLEEKINGVENMIYMSSKSSSDGACSITVTFEVGTDVDLATVLVQNRVKEAEPGLPEDVKRQGISVEKQSSSMTLMVNLVSPNKTFDELYLSNYATMRIKDVLGRIKGISKVDILGAKDFGMRIWIDPDIMKIRGLTTTDVIGALQEQNVQVAAGKIGAAPSPERQAFEYSITTLGRLSTVEQFENIVVKRGDEGQLLRMKDIARVELGAQAYHWRVTLSGEPSIALAIYPAPGANALNIAEQVKSEMTRLSKDFPEDFEHRIVYDTTEYINQSVKEVIITLITAILLVVLTVYIFLQDFRTTLIPALTIPVSLLGTFGVMLATGMTVNALTMFGLILVIGIVVDDAILVVENTMRILDEEGLSVKEATVKSMKEITGPIVATTLVLLAVFVPTIVMPGISGQLYRPFALTISIATLFSSINALTLSPALCGMLLRPSSQKSFFVFTWFNHFLSKATSGYAKILRSILRKTVLGCIIFAGMMAATYFGITKLPTGFIPSEDEGIFFISVQLPDASSLERTNKVMDTVAEIVNQTSGIRASVNIAGFSLLDSVVTPNAGTVWVVLDHWDARKTPETQIESIIGLLNRQFFDLQDAVIFAVRPPPIPGLGTVGGFSMELQDRESTGLDLLQQVAQDLVREGNKNPVLMQMNTTFRSGVPQLFLEVDRVKAKRLDVPLDAIFTTLQSNLGSAYTNDFNLYGRVWRVVIQADQQARSQREDITKLEVRSRSGNMIPLSTLVEVKNTVGPTVMSRHNLYQSANITGDARTGFSSSQAVEAITDIASQVLPPSLGFEWSGVTYQEVQAGNTAILIFALALIFVYLFLAAQYESWTLPLGVMLTVPTAVLGAALATRMRGLDNNVYTQIGLVLLIGLAAKSAILIIEFASQLYQTGKSPIEAATESTRLRFRAILMTALSFILGVIPLVIATGAGAASRVSLGTAVLGGMLFATIGGILFAPFIFYVVQSLADKFKPNHAPLPSEEVNS
ncbi:MAG: multidrug efflux RND transporter permease subunit [Verrucomicrobiota bacterium]